MPTLPHKGFIGKFCIHQLIEESGYLFAIHRSIQIRSDSREVDPFAQVIVTTVLQTLKEDGDPLLRRRIPLLVDQPPEIVWKGVFLSQVKINHR
jgi:hypothetical protein